LEWCGCVVACLLWLLEHCLWGVRARGLRAVRCRA